MKPEIRRARSLREIEEEVEAEGREWTRRRLQERLQEEAARSGEVFPPERPPSDASAGSGDAAADERRSR